MELQNDVCVTVVRIVARQNINVKIWGRMSPHGVGDEDVIFQKMGLLSFAKQKR